MNPTLKTVVKFFKTHAFVAGVIGIGNSFLAYLQSEGLHVEWVAMIFNGLTLAYSHMKNQNPKAETPPNG